MINIYLLNPIIFALILYLATIPAHAQAPEERAPSLAPQPRYNHYTEDPKVIANRVRNSDCYKNRVKRNYKFSYDRGSLAKAQKDQKDTYYYAKAVPYFTNDKLSAIRIFGFRKNGLFDKVGFCSGDVIKAANSKKVERLEDLLKGIYGALESGRVVVLLKTIDGEKELEISVDT